MNITTKFSIGDVVYHGRNTTAPVRVECPDCKGTKEWTVTSPAGQTMTTGCPTCETLYGSTGYTERHERFPIVETLTIGSVRYDSHDEEPVSYMCRETGVGSGSVWYESRLRDNRGDAEADAVASIAISEKQIADANAAYERDRAKRAARAAKRRASK